MKAAIAVAVLVSSISLAYANFVSAADTVDLSVAAQAEARLVRMAGNAKLVNAPAVLKALRDGAERTAIIVALKPTPQANFLAEISRPAMRRPLEVEAAGATVFYDLEDPGIRSALNATVTETVERVVASLDVPGMTVGSKFSYQFGFAATVTAEALEAILARPDVASVEKDIEVTFQTRQGIPVMNATVPRSSYTGRGVAIAIVDSGIDTSHPKLGGSRDSIFNAKVIGGWDVADGDGDPRPGYGEDGGYHGTAVAGVAAGDLGDEGDYIGGVAPDAKLYAIKISQRNSGSMNISTGIEGMEWAIKHQNDNPAYPILIMNNSWGGYDSGSYCDGQYQQIAQTARNAAAAGITVFAASGNNGYCKALNVPACLSTVISVGAVYDADIGPSPEWCVSENSCAPSKRRAFGGCDSGWSAGDSNTWAKKVTSYSNSASILNLFAPSNNAYTPTIVGSTYNNYMPNFGGTSAASPYAAGAAAVLQEAAKSKLGRYLKPEEVRQYLASTGEMITDGKVAVTKPLVNLLAAVAAIPGGSQLALSLTVQGAGSGSVVSAPAGIDCSSSRTCIAQFDMGTTVRLTASPADGSAFYGWIGAGCSGTGTCTVPMVRAQQVWATFAKTASPMHDLRVTVQGNGVGKVTSVPGGIDCGDACVGRYNIGTMVTLSARAAPGSAFFGWFGNKACSGTGICTIAMSEQQQVWATFARTQ